MVAQLVEHKLPKLEPAQPSPNTHVRLKAGPVGRQRQRISVCEYIEEAVARQNGTTLSPERRAFLRRRAAKAGPWRLGERLEAYRAQLERQREAKRERR